MRTVQQTRAAVTVAVFLLLLFGLTLVNLLTPSKDFSENENDYLAQLPEWNWSEVFSGRYGQDFEEYISDQFVGRDGWITAKVLAQRAMGRRDDNGVYFGSDGFLIERHDQSEIEPERLERNTERMCQFVASAAQTLGEERVSVMLVPTAANILSERLPPFAVDFDQDALIDSVRDALPAGNFIDVRPTLREHQEEYIYYRTDHHWTTRGAYYAYRAWCDAAGIEGETEEDFTVAPVSDAFLGTVFSKVLLLTAQPDTIHAWLPKEPVQYRTTINMGEREMDGLYDPSYLEKKDKYSYFLSGNNAEVRIEGPNQNGRRLLVIKDSYAHSLAPFAANDFEEVCLIDFRYFNYPLSQYMQEREITDVLILYNTVNFAKDVDMAKFLK